jgi:hypothetical protein
MTPTAVGSARFVCCLVCLAILAVAVSACGRAEPDNKTTSHAASHDQATAKAQKKRPTLPRPSVTPAARAEHEMEAKERAKGEEVEKYAGLGAPKAQFLAGNYAFTPEDEPREAPEGSKKDVIEALSRSGRVTKYLAVFYFDPPPSDSEKLLLVARIYLPDDASVVRETSTCTDWHSAILGELVGKSYAEATTISEVPSVTMEAVSRPEC